MSGFQLAANEITLVTFTTLAPAGAFACVLIAILLATDVLDAKERERVSHMTILPELFAIVGLVASATHLGTPANALYVLTGIGRSPLSNEVACAAVFLASCGFFWLYSFSRTPHILLQRIWSGVNAVLGLACIAFIAFAYDVFTVPTWSSVWVPVSVMFEAIPGGTLLSALTLRIASATHPRVPVARWIGIAAAGFLLCSVVVLCLQNGQLHELRSGIGYATDLVPRYPLAIGIYGVCGAVAYALLLLPLFHGDKPSTARLVWCNVLFLAGLFVVRFAFYMMHMTAGIGV